MKSQTHSSNRLWMQLTEESSCKNAGWQGLLSTNQF
jgi:hypothetical protein